MNEQIEVVAGDASVFLPDESLRRTVRARPVTGSVNVTQAEFRMYEVQLVAAQRGLSGDDAVLALIREVTSGMKPISSYLDPRKPLKKEDEARRVAYEAFVVNGRKRTKLANRALSIWPNCAEAYLVLAEDEGGEERARILKEGLEAAKRGLLEEYDANAVERVLAAADGSPVLGADEFDPTYAGDTEIRFWDEQPTRAYLRLSNQLAQEHASAGDWKKALSLLRHTLRLSHQDGLGSRYVMAGYLAAIIVAGDEAEALEELGRLLRIYSADESAHWLILRAWWAYRSGKTEGFEVLAGAAINANRKILPVLMGMVPSKMLKDAAEAEFLPPDSLEEAADFVTRTAVHFLSETEFWKAMSDAMINEYQGAWTRGEITADDEE